MESVMEIERENLLENQSKRISRNYEKCKYARRRLSIRRTKIFNKLLGETWVESNYDAK